MICNEKTSKQEKYGFIQIPQDVLNNSGIVLSGNNIYIGPAEKSKNDIIVHVSLPHTLANYRFFNRGTTCGGNRWLINTLSALTELINNDQLSNAKKDKLYEKLINYIWIIHHTDNNKYNSKLAGINSLSTCCLDNTFCIERIKNNNSVCAHCYAATQQKIQYGLQEHNIINSLILRNIVIPAKYWKKYVNPADISKYFRIESFGDVQNKTQALNYIELIKAFSRVHFAVWTKNIGIWAFAFMESEKPKNCSFVVSSNKLNYCELYHLKTFNFIDHIFTVYDKKYIKPNDININCGGKKCMECIKRRKNCYFSDGETIINEELK